VKFSRNDAGISFEYDSVNSRQGPPHCQVGNLREVGIGPDDCGISDERTAGNLRSRPM
jgi:hypothetical protein